MTSTPAAIRLKVLSHMTAIVLVPTIPVLIWWKVARDDREMHAESIRTKVRVPNVQTIDDLLVEKCRPGDVLIFDRRWEKCAAGPMAALSCVLARSLLCNDQDPTQIRSVEVGKFDHCGIVVPGYVTNKKDKYDPSNLLLLEATSGSGIVARPLLTRLEMSQSRTVMLLPLHLPGDNNRDGDGDDDQLVPEKTQRLRAYIEDQLCTFRDKWIQNSLEQNYKSAHSSLSVLGALAYTMGLADVSQGPTSPSAWVVMSALQAAGVGENIRDRAALETKVEDFLRDFRFQETDSVRLRPGFKFLPPIPFREMSRS